MAAEAGLERLSLNVWTTRHWPLPEIVAGCARAGIPGIGLWREKVAEVGIDKAARLITDQGLTVTSLCRGGFFTAGGYDNHAAVDEAAAVGAPVLVLVVGGLPEGSKDLAGARETVAAGIAST